MDAKKLRVVAYLAEKYGNGYVLFSTRKIPIILNIHFKDIDAVKNELDKIELMTDRCGARVRNTDVCYDSNLCPYAVMDPICLGEKLDQFWRDDPDGFKIKISINGCEKQCTTPRVLADIGFVGVMRDGKIGYDVYLGGILGLDPFIGVRMAELLSKKECIKFVNNYINFIRKEGCEDGHERSAALIRRLGEDAVKKAVTKDIQKGFIIKPFSCETKQRARTDRAILRIRATNGEVNSNQVRKIADIAEKYGLDFIHFAVRGDPEIPGIYQGAFEFIEKELKEVGLSLLDKRVDNLQTCYGRYCVNSNLDT